ncbi:MAG: hypothetical protein ACI4U3_05675 [Traorella sp.]
MNIALLFGGNSIEHEISILTALQLIKYFKEDKMIPIYISKDNQFYIGKELLDFDFYSKINLKKCQSVIFENHNQEHFIRIKKSFRKPIPIDLVIPCMHGTSGEDGSIQGMLEILNIPYAQSKLSTCAICMDKDLTRKMFDVFKIPHTLGVTLIKDKTIHQLDCLNEIKIPKPWILKPAKGGSSIGINCVNDDEHMVLKVCETFAYDNKIILEEKLENFREFNVAIVGDEYEQIISNIEEIHSVHDFYSYSDKYGGSIVKQNLTQRTLPAMIEDDLAEEIKKMAIKAFLDFECSGVVRFDFLYDDHLMLNEINIIPGSFSIYLFRNICLPEKIMEMIIHIAKRQYVKKKREIRQIDSFIFKKKWNQMILKK